MPEIESIQEIIKRVSPYYNKKGEPEVSHKIVYNSSSETLEPIYFWIVDFLADIGLDVEKLTDNFTSSPGSGHFGELGQRATIMQQQGSKILADINTVLRSILNLIYDLKEFRIRLDQYKSLKSDDKDTKESARLSLKQLWLDKVDIQKGNSSIKAMALSQAGFVTLLDAFLAMKDETLKDSKGNEIDLNERVKRILKPRIREFNIWVEQSEKELSKRYELEKNYLRSQVNSLKLYSRWAKPYLKAAQDLEQKDSGRSPDLVKTFNSILLELTLFGKSKINIKKSSISGDFPSEFSNEKFIKSLKRDYYACVLVDLNFRGIPQRISSGAQGHYAFGGKTEVTFNAYALNSEELKKLDEELDKSDIGDALTLIEGSTGESLKQLQEEINFFLDEKDSSESESKEKEKISGTNPFLALIGHYNKKDEKPKEKKSKKKEDKIQKDNWIESTHIRPFTAEEAKTKTFTIFDVYKKTHGMVSYT